MSYTPPAGNEVELPFVLGGYAKPDGNSVVLNFDTTKITTVSGVAVTVIGITGDATGESVQAVSGDGGAVLVAASGDGVIGCSGEASAETLSAKGTGSVSSTPIIVQPILSEGGAAIGLSAHGQGAVGCSADAVGVIEMYGLGVGRCFAQVVGDGAAYLLYAEGDGFVTREEEGFDVLFVRTILPRFEVRT